MCEPKLRFTWRNGELKMKRHKWQVWTEDEQGNETIVFEGSHTQALSYYRKHGGSQAALHIGYDISD